MRENTVARNYAEALFDLGQRHGTTEDFADDLDQVSALLEESARIRTFMETPKVEPEAKKAIIRRSLQGHVSPLFMNFLLVVIDKRRQRLLSLIAREYHAILDEHLGRLHVQVTLAREPDERMRGEIADGLSHALGRTAVPHVRVNPDILGGIVVRYGDRVIDGSLRRRLLSLRRRMLKAEVPGGV